MKWYTHACPTCGGDLHDSDERGWVECLLCARSFRASEVLEQPPVELLSISSRRPQLELAVAAAGGAHERQAA
jgi:hypothetical protein